MLFLFLLSWLWPALKIHTNFAPVRGSDLGNHQGTLCPMTPSSSTTEWEWQSCVSLENKPLQGSTWHSGPALLSVAELEPGLSSQEECVSFLCTVESMQLFLPTLLAKGCWLRYMSCILLKKKKKKSINFSYPSYRKHRGVEKEWREKQEIAPFNFK